MSDRTTDYTLLKRASGGDETAFLLLYERHRNTIFRFVYRMLGSVELAEDITHDCFLSLLKHPERFDPSRGAALGTYLCAAARNLAIKQFRHIESEVAVEVPVDLPHVSEAHGPLRRLIDEELSARVREVIGELPPLQREALILFEYEELPLAEIASIVGTDVGTVKSRLHRARERLKKVFAPYFYGDSDKAEATER